MPVCTCVVLLVNLYAHTHVLSMSMSEGKYIVDKALLPIIVLHTTELASDSNTAYD